MDRSSAVQEFIALAGVLDGRGQFDLADRMERLAINLNDLGESYLQGFDPQHPTFRGPLWNPIQRPQFADPDSPQYDPDRVLPGHGEWLQSPEVMGGNVASGFDKVDRRDRPGDPNARVHSYGSLDKDRIMEQVMADIRENFPEYKDVEDDELISRLIHAVYVSLKYGDDELLPQFEAAVSAGQRIDYDPEILEQANNEISRLISDKFNEIEQTEQDSYEEQGPEPVMPWE